MKATLQQILATVPKTCPVCGYATVLSTDMAHLYCSNVSCVGNFARKLELFAKMFDMDYFGPANCEKLAEEISEFHELFQLPLGSCQRILGDGMGGHIYNNIQNHKTVKLEKFLASLCIPKLGPSTAKLFAETFGTLSRIRFLTVEDVLNNIPRSGKESATILVYGIQYAASKIDALLRYVKVIDFVSTKVGAKLNGEKVCITGALSVPRDEWKRRIEDNGGQMVDSVSRNTTVLITNETSGSTKYRKALDLGVKIETEEWLINKLK